MPLPRANRPRNIFYFQSDVSVFSTFHLCQWYTSRLSSPPLLFVIEHLACAIHQDASIRVSQHPPSITSCPFTLTISWSTFNNPKPPYHHFSWNSVVWAPSVISNSIYPKQRLLMSPSMMSSLQTNFSFQWQTKGIFLPRGHYFLQSLIFILIELYSPTLLHMKRFRRVGRFLITMVRAN